MKRNLLPATALAAITMAALGLATAGAQDTIYRYSYINGNLNGTFDYPTGFATPVGTNAPTELAGATWADLIESGQVWGTGHTNLVRAFDWAEDNQVSYLTPDGVATWYFSTNANTNAQSGTPGRTTFSGGVFDGQSIIGNQNIIAVYDDQVVLYNPSSGSDSTSLTLYSVNTGLATLVNFGFNTFSGAGPLSGLSLSSQLPNLIGAEDGYLWFLDPDGSFSAYGITSGATVLNPTWTTFTDGPMGGMTLTEALDSGKYLGIGAGPDFYFTETTIPEPSTVLLLGGVGVLALARHLRRARS